MAFPPIESSIKHSGITHRDQYDEYQETMFEESPDLQESYETIDASADATFETADGRLESESEPKLHREPELASPPTSIPNQPRIKNQDSPSATVLTADDFAALEDRVLRAVDLVRRERHARSAAEQRVSHLESQLKEAESQALTIDHLQQEVETLRVEREQVRSRIDRLLSQLDALEL
jgi:hypothetical protein